MKGVPNCFIAVCAWMMVNVATAEPAIQDARQLLAQQPFEVTRIYQLVKPELRLSPAWLQRDWHLLATRAYLQLRNWPKATETLLAADASLTYGLSVAELALLAGTLSYQQQRPRNAWFWFRCAATFDTSPHTRARILLNLGVMASRQQQQKQAHDYYQQGMQLAEAHQFTDLLPMYYNNFGLWFWRNKMLGPAEQMLRQALYQHSRVSGPEAQARAMLNLLVVLVSSRQWDRFIRYQSESEALVKRQENPDYRLLLQLLKGLHQLELSVVNNTSSPEKQSLLPAETEVQSTDLIQLASQLKSGALRQSVSMLLSQFAVDWQPAEPAEQTEQFLALPNTQLQCQNISY